MMVCNNLIVMCVEPLVVAELSFLWFVIIWIHVLVMWFKCLSWWLFLSFLLGCVILVICIHGFVSDTCAQPSDMCVMINLSLCSVCAHNGHFRPILIIWQICTQIGGVIRTHIQNLSLIFLSHIFSNFLSTITKKGEIVSAINLDEGFGNWLTKQCETLTILSKCDRQRFHVIKNPRRQFNATFMMSRIKWLTKIPQKFTMRNLLLSRRQFKKNSHSRTKFWWPL